MKDLKSKTSTLMNTKEFLKIAGPILEKIKPLAREYHLLTNKPIGVTGEIAEYEAIRIFKLDVAPARLSGYDAIRWVNGEEQKIQIKGRTILPNSRSSQRMGAIQLDKDWDFVMLVLLDEEYNPMEIFEANREVIKGALEKPGSKARNERGQLDVTKFKSISTLIWQK